MLILTGKEIEDLARCAGFQIVEQNYDDERECEIVIVDCPEDGIEDDDGKRTHYAHIAYFADYPDEGAFSLGDEIPPHNVEGNRPPRTSDDQE